MKRVISILFLSALLVACGTTQTERTVSGGGMGALLGAGIGSIWHQPATGAAIGAGIGAIGGALSPPPQGPVYPQQYAYPQQPYNEPPCHYYDSQGICRSY
jgi:hypothetical protein